MEPSKVEVGRSLPSPTRILMALHLVNVVTDEDSLLRGLQLPSIGNAVKV